MSRTRLRWTAFRRNCAMIFNDKKSAEEWAKRNLGQYSWETDEIKGGPRES